MKVVECIMCGKLDEGILCKKCENKFKDRISNYIKIPYNIGDKCYTFVRNRGNGPTIELGEFNYNTWHLKNFIKDLNEGNMEMIERYCEIIEPNHLFLFKVDQYERPLSKIFKSYDDCLNANIEEFKEYIIDQNSKMLYDLIYEKFESLDPEYVRDIVKNKSYMESVIHNFAEDINKQRKFKIEEYNRLKDEISTEVKNQIKNETISEERNKELQDMYLTGKQDIVYEMIKNFLKSDSAIKFNITGIDVKVENGYVNAEWKFGDRKKGDIL